ncbi:MAG: CAP domain-containing protein [Chloroflexi bacterium]|nr:CAP domain-containing protein [Chloroflexota bacterium]
MTFRVVDKDNKLSSKEWAELNKWLKVDKQTPNPQLPPTKPRKPRKPVFKGIFWSVAIVATLFFIKDWIFQPPSPPEPPIPTTIPPVVATPTLTPTPITQPAPPSDYNLFKNQQGVFSLEYPKDWTIKDSTITKDKISILLAGSITGSSPCEISITFTSNSTDAKSYWQTLVKKSVGFLMSRESIDIGTLKFFELQEDTNGLFGRTLLTSEFGGILTGTRTFPKYKLEAKQADALDTYLEHALLTFSLNPDMLSKLGVSNTPATFPTPKPSPAIVPPTPTFTSPPIPTTPVASEQEQLAQYMLGLINKDRNGRGQPPVTLGSNIAAQKHAEDMLANYYLSHWDTQGLKPYMRYTLSGGFNYEAENSSYSGWYDKTSDASRYVTLNVRQDLEDHEYAMVFDDALSGWGHRDNILNKWHKKVNLGIAYDKHRLALVQQFEGDYINFTKLPSLAGGKLSLSGKVGQGSLESVALYFDPLPQFLTQKQLLDGPRSYSLGMEAGYIVPPPYRMTGVDYVQASRWNVSANGSFTIEADVNRLLKRGAGVYTVVIWGKLGIEDVNLTNYAIFVR